MYNQKVCFAYSFVTFTQLPAHLTHRYLIQGGDSIVLFLFFILDLQ